MPESTKSPAEVLGAAADLLESPGAWTQGQCARGEDKSWPNPEDEEATCWCGVGATMRIAYFVYGLGSPVEGAAINALHAYAGSLGYRSFGAFNDAPERTQAEVVAALREAARQASIRGGEA